MDYYLKYIMTTFLMDQGPLHWAHAAAHFTKSYSYSSMSMNGEEQRTGVRPAIVQWANATVNLLHA
jgi:hypothetical protein